jgi:hypothetical protein
MTSGTFLIPCSCEPNRQSADGRTTRTIERMIRFAKNEEPARIGT